MNDVLTTKYWEATTSNAVRCNLCPHRCNIPDNKYGICGTRYNRAGTLITTGYGIVSSIALDPIEKKPLYMYRPGSMILSIGGFGCNLRCPFCQNHEISMPNNTKEIVQKEIVCKESQTKGNVQNACVHHGNIPEHTKFHSPKALTALARQTVIDGNIGVAYTFNEPLINYEYLYDCAVDVHDAGLSNIIVTNGYVNDEPLSELLPLIDAMNIDLKGFTEDFYNKLGGTLEPVKQSISKSNKYCHVEITTLVIPGENENDIEELAKWIASIDPAIPLHLTRFFPRYEYIDKTPTSSKTIYRSRDVALKYLHTVFTGNMR